MTGTVTGPRRIDPALLVVLAGVSAALHVGKLPPALPVLRESLGISLVQAGFMLSLVQFAGMALGLLVGLAADGWGLRRSMVTGLLVLFGASVWGGFAQDAGSLLALRAVEGFGFLLASLPGPSLIRRLVPPQRISAMLGLWGAYMPFGTAAALLGGPWVLAHAGWRFWWDLIGGLSLLMALALWRWVPPDLAVLSPQAGGRPAPEPWARRLGRTLRAPGPWLVALTFAMYSGQWLAVVGFLPSIYAQAGISGGVGGVLTALAAAVNMGGNIVSGRLLQRGWRADSLLYIGFAAMGVGAFAAFTGLPDTVWPAPLRFVAVLLFSMVGGMIPGTLFSLGVKLAPSEDTVSTTVGWMQQWSALGQFAGPPIVGWLAGRVGGWQWTWVATGACTVIGMGLSARIARLLRA